ncbi:MAG: SHOCT domain-containing protein [Lentisphaeria bacterium]|jgi:hypothetical protein
MKTGMAILTSFGILVAFFFLCIIHPLLGFVLLIGTIIWAGNDAKKIELNKYKLNGVTTPMNTVICCILLWVVAFPWYLVNKGKIARGEAELIKGCTLSCKESSTSPVSCQTKDDKLAQLEKLAHLKEKGILSEEEFQAEKAKLLSL